MIEGPVAKEHDRRYDRVALPCVAELTSLLRETKERLGEVRQPILVIQVRKDRLIEPGNADYIFKHVASMEKRVLWLENSDHAATFDFDKQILFKEAAVFSAITYFTWVIRHHHMV